MMIRFNDDRDLAVFEPVLFSSEFFGGQVLYEGTSGILSGGTLSQSGIDLMNRGAEAGGVVFVHDTERSYEQLLEILSVESNDTLHISALRSSREGVSIVPEDRESVVFTIISYGPQIHAVFLELTERFGIRPGRSGSEYGAENILNPDTLRAVSVYGTLAKIYASLCSENTDERYCHKRNHYEGEYRKGLERVRIELDANSDGKAEEVRRGDATQLIRE